MSIVWADRAPVGWIEDLEELCINRGFRAAISPIHDKDFWTDRDEAANPEHVSGTAKPAHYHVLITCPDGSVTENTIKKLLEPIATTFKKVTANEGGLGAQYEYLTHKNSPSKTRYDETKITLINGFDPLSVKTPHSRSQKLVVRRNIREMIVARRITSLIDLEERLEKAGMVDELTYIESAPYKVKVLLDDNARRLDRYNLGGFVDECYQDDYTTQ